MNDPANEVFEPGGICSEKQVGVLKEFVEAYGHLEGHSQNCVCAPCEAYERAKAVLKGPGTCCEGYAKHCDAHSVGCVFSEKQEGA